MLLGFCIWLYVVLVVVVILMICYYCRKFCWGSCCCDINGFCISTFGGAINEHSFAPQIWLFHEIERIIVPLVLNSKEIVNLLLR